MSDTIPADLLMDMVDGSLDYTGTWGNLWGFYFAQGRTVVTVSLAPTHDDIGEAITVGCLAVSLGASQGIWVASAMSTDYPIGDPFFVMCYTDSWGGQSMRRRRLSMCDDGAVGPVGEWEPRPVEGSRFLQGVSVPWWNPPGDAAAIRQVLESRGHYIAT